MEEKYSPQWVLSFKWIKELETLICKHPEQFITQEIFRMTLAELWGVYKHLESIDSRKIKGEG